MRRWLVIAAAVVVVTTEAGLLLTARGNRREATGGRVEMTERELRLVEVPGESTVTALEIDWRCVSKRPERWRGDRRPAWLDREKLVELGFDCSVPVGLPGAAAHYRSQAPRTAFLLLEYKGDAWRTASETRPGASRLFVVDAGRDAVALRKRHPDDGRYLLAKGVVQVWFEDRDPEDGRRLTEPRLGGWIETLRPGVVFVPLPYSRDLRAWAAGKPGREGAGTDEREPRYAVSLAWGTRCEPWVEGVRAIR